MWGTGRSHQATTIKEPLDMAQQRSGREIRFQRLFGDGRAVVIAIDHGLFDGPIPGMEVLPETAKRINPIVDAVLLAPGMLRHCSDVFAAPKRPLAMVRLNWNTVYCFGLGYGKARSVVAYEVEDALREGMDVALVSLTLRTGDEERDAENVEVFTRTTIACHALGIPVVGEYFPTGHTQMSPEQLHEDVLMGSRIVCELGADAVKTFHTHEFRAVTSSCPVPVLGLGAEKLPTQRDALDLAAREVADGAGGVVFGRNAIQVSNPAAFQAALCGVVKHGQTSEEAIVKFALEE
jgi:DhnA family fructose-bisphosphate aldolase class Ia